METENLQNCARERLESELRDINANPPTQISFGPVGSDDMFHWQGIIFGPVGTPLEGHIFDLSIQFPIDYPFKPPKVKFQTKVYHPNICADGTVDINILGDQWSSALTTEKLLLSICSVLLDPLVEFSPKPISNLHRHGKDCCKKKARGWRKQLLRCWSRIKTFVVVRTQCYSCKPGRRGVLYKHYSF